MKTHGISLGNIQLKNNVFLAPIAGYTDYSFRRLAIKLGYGLTFTELISAKGVVYNNKGNEALLYSGEDYENTAVQLFGSEPYYMRKACEDEQLSKYKIVDINMGCPVPKIFKNGEGSALLKDILKAESVVKECVKSGKVVTVKIRTGLTVGDDIAFEYAKMAEQSGAKLITIHGRVRESYYSGEPDFNAIEKAKKSVSIPVIANGGIFTESDADFMLERTGADGIMLARGGIADPFLVARLTNTPHDNDLKKFILEHLKLRKEFVSEKRSALEFRKYVPYYFRGMDGVKDLKLKLFQANTIDEMIELIENNL